jgi:hypothetical protein
VPERVLLVLARDVGLTSALRRMLGREGFPVRTGHSWGEGGREPRRPYAPVGTAGAVLPPPVT